MGSGQGSRRSALALALALGLALVASGCVQNLAAPARTEDDYRAAVGKTADAASSAVGTTKLLADAAIAGDAFFPYLAVAVSESEDELNATAETFASIQPPDAPSLDLRARTLDALRQAQDHVSAARITIRSGTAVGLDQVRDQLDQDAQALDDLSSQVSG